MNSKTFHFISASLVTVFGSLAAFQWTDIVSAHTAAEIVVGLGFAKALFSAFGNTDASNAS